MDTAPVPAATFQAPRQTGVQLPVVRTRRRQAAAAQPASCLADHRSLPLPLRAGIEHT